MNRKNLHALSLLADDQRIAIQIFTRNKSAVKNNILQATGLNRGNERWIPNASKKIHSVWTLPCTGTQLRSHFFNLSTSVNWKKNRKNRIIIPRSKDFNLLPAV